MCCLSSFCCFEPSPIWKRKAGQEQGRKYHSATAWIRNRWGQSAGIQLLSPLTFGMLRSRCQGAALAQNKKSGLRGPFQSPSSKSFLPEDRGKPTRKIRLRVLPSHLNLLFQMTSRHGQRGLGGGCGWREQGWVSIEQQSQSPKYSDWKKDKRSLH